MPPFPGGKNRQDSPKRAALPFFYGFVKNDTGVSRAKKRILSR